MIYDYSESILQLIKEKNIKKIAEIGIWKSKNLRYIFKRKPSLIEYWAIDQWQYLGEGYGRMSNIVQSEWDALYSFSCSLMRWIPQLRVVRLTSEEASKIFPDGYFDFVFIDADHGYEAVKKDIQCWLPKVKKGGVLGGHDYGSTRHNHAGVKRAVDELFKVRLMEGLVWIYER